MKAVLITYNVAIHDEVMEKLTSMDLLDGFTRLERVIGKGKSSGPHFGSHIWPAYNSALLIVTEEEKSARILQAVRELREKFAKEGIKAFSWTIEEIT